MVLSKQGIEAATRLNSFYQQAGADILDADGNPMLNTDAGRAALEFMTALVADGSAPEGVLELPDMQGAWLEATIFGSPPTAISSPRSRRRSASSRQVSSSKPRLASPPR